VALFAQAKPSETINTTRYSEQIAFLPLMILRAKTTRLYAP
jgi:hypothetical protein